MGKRGPKKTPTKILKLRDSRRVEDRPKNEPIPVSGIPKPPKWLRGEGLAEWKRKAPLLYAQGTLTLIDDTALAAYCRAYELFHTADKMLQDKEANGDLMIERANKSKMINPLITIMKQSLELMNKLAAEFGMTPSGRTGINVPVIPKTQTPAQKWLAKQG